MTTQFVGLIGFPVEHSLSPAFQQAAFDALNLDVRYELWPTADDEMDQRVTSLRLDRYLGANVTVPQKERSFAIMDTVSDIAQRAGAVNTIITRAGQLHGENTDVPGFLTPLQQRGFELSQMQVVVLGAGGAARGVVVALQTAGCQHIVVANRTVERAERLALEVGGRIQVTGIDDSLAPWLDTADLLVNATALGWQDDRSPLAEPLLGALAPAALVYDLTYRETPLLRAAAQRGYATLDGLEMLVAQGAESFRLWTGLEPPLELMLAAARRAAAAR